MPVSTDGSVGLRLGMGRGNFAHFSGFTIGLQDMGIHKRLYPDQSETSTRGLDGDDRKRQLGYLRDLRSFLVPLPEEGGAQIRLGLLEASNGSAKDGGGAGN